MMKLPVKISGTVIHGKALGNTYDYPTANIMPCEDVSGLNLGVYLSVITVDRKQYPAITNLGVRPTVSDDGTVCAETYIYDYDRDLYGKEVAVTLLEFCRSERKFASVDELYETVANDLKEGRIRHGI